MMESLLNYNRKPKYRRLSSGNGHTSSCIPLLEVESQDDDEEINLSTNETLNHTSLQPAYEQLIERPIKHGETLMSLSLKYRIPVSELKRVNKLQKEAELYALSSIKIPVRPNSFLSEVLAKEAEEEEQANIKSSPRESLLGVRTSVSETESDTEMHVGVISIGQILKEKKTRREAQRFLKNMQEDLALLQEKTQSYKGSLDEAATALTDVRFQALNTRPQSFFDSFSGVDCGMSWKWLLCIGLVIIFGVPAICIYFKVFS